MRRGMGLADIMLYVFIFFLVMFALLLTSLASQDDSLIKTVEIVSAESSRVVDSAVSMRSVLQGVSELYVSGESETSSDQVFEGNYEVFNISHAELASMAASYAFVPFGSIEQVRPSFWYEYALLHSMFVVLTVIPPDYEGPGSAVDRALRFFSAGSPVFSYGFSDASQISVSRQVMIPGYDRGEPVARKVTFDVQNRGIVIERECEECYKGVSGGR